MNEWWKPDPTQSPAVGGNVRIGVSSPAALAKSPAYQVLTSGGTQTSGQGINNAGLQALARGIAQGGTGPSPYTRAPATRPASTGSSGGRGGGGGGGGGGPAGMSQAQLDQLMALMGAGRPKAQTATNLDLPEFQGQFNNAQYEQLRSGLSGALGQAQNVANQATGNLNNFLTSNYRNPYAQGPPQTQAPGMDQQAMGRFLSSQGGMSPDLAASEAQGRAAANQGFANLWQTLGGNEDLAQRNRLTNAQIMNQDVMNRIEGERIAGTTGIGMQESQARSAYEQAMQERNWQTQQQEAMENWQRQNQVTDLNAQNNNAYTNQVLQALLGLVPSAPGLNIPTAQSLGFG